MTEANEPGRMVGVDVLAAVIDAIPGKSIDVNTDLNRVWGRELVTEEIDEHTLRISLKEKA